MPEMSHFSNRSEGGRRLGRAICSAGLIALAALALTTPGSRAAGTADIQATDTYLQADYEYDRALLENVAASAAADTKLSTSIGRECAGALAGAPRQGDEGPSEEAPLPPRARGEAQRGQRQLETLEEELGRTLAAALYAPDLAALEAFATKIDPLSWSDPRLAPLARFDLGLDREELTPPALDVCSDMKAWQQSGYSTLSSSSRAFEAAQTARSEQSPPGGSLSSLLKQYEGAHERALIKRREALRKRLTAVLIKAETGRSNLRQALGLPESLLEARERAPVLGHLKAAAGETVTVRRVSAAGPFGGHCAHPISIEFATESKQGEFSGSSSTGACLSRHEERNPSSSCHGTVQSLTSIVPAGIDSVRLKLSNGRTITSRVVKIPRHDGGPGGVYAQSIRGYRPYPVSLAELGAHGKVVQVIKLNRNLLCRREPASADQGPRFVALAHASTPDGEAFTFQGMLFTFEHHTEFSLSSLPLGNQSGQDESSSSSEPAEKPKAFPFQLVNECAPHAYTIVYGILASPGDTVVAQTADGPVALTKVELAANLQSGGPLLYGVFRSVPLELIVRRSDGTTLYTESLATKAKEEAEYCEGYVEP